MAMESPDSNVDIFYVEDDIVDIENLKRIFKKINESCTICTASNGEEALNKLYGRNGEEKIIPKVVLLDINMPKVSGIELLKLIRQDPKLTFTEIFLLTNAYTTEDKIATKDLNVRNQIIKPLEYGDALNIYWTIQNS